jgi:hypothetical protein
MTMHRPCLSVALLVLFSAAGCNDHLMDDDYGGIEVDASSPTAETAFTTQDDWSVHVDRFLVHVTQMNVTGADQVLTASATPEVVDLAKPGQKTLLSASARKARLWESFDFEIGPASEDGEIAVVDPATPDDAAALHKDGLSILIEGSATHGADTKKFSWGFTTDTIHSECEGGIVVPPNGTTPAEIVFRADVLFATDPTGAMPGLAFQPFADADVDADNVITQDELVASADRAAAVQEATRHIVGSFRGTGKCKSAPAGQ